MPIPPPPTPPPTAANASTQAPRGGSGAALPRHDPESFQPAAAILAFIFPGAGHVFLGESRRGVLIAAGILGLFFGGLLIGGIDVIDRKHNPVNLFGRSTVNAWFFGQAMVGPLTFGADYLHQNRFKVIDPATGEARSPRPEIRDMSGNVLAPAEVRGPGGIAQPGAPGQLPPKSRSLGRMNELGVLFVTIAGMLNFIVILDAAFYRRKLRDKAIEGAGRFLGAQRGGMPGGGA